MGAPLTMLAAAVLALSGSGLAAQPAAADANSSFFFSSEEIGPSGTTPSFEMGAPWTMNWNFSCADYSQGGSFSLAVNQPSGDHAVDAGVNESAERDAGTINFSDTGTFSLTLTSGCYWWVQIYPTSTPSPILARPASVTYPATPDPFFVGVATDRGGQGIWTARADGLVQGYLGGIVDGDPVGVHLNSPIVSLAAGRYGGYYLLGGDGGVFSYAGPFYGSTGSMRLNRPVDGMAVTPDGLGYWLVASDGGIFAFGDAEFLGSTGSFRLNQPVVGMVAYDGGYTLVAADGGVFNFGTPFLGSLGSVHLAAPIVGMAATPDGGRYWLVARDGGVFSFGDAGFFGSGVGSGKTFTGIASTPNGSGYWLIASDGTVLNFGDAASVPSPT